MRFSSVKARPLLVIGVVVVAAASSGSTDPSSTAGEYRDPSGLLIVQENRDPVVEDGLRDAWAAYDALTEQFPDDFGYASPLIESGRIEVATRTERGRTILEAFAAGTPPRLEGSADNPSEESSKRQQALSEAAGGAGALQPRQVAAVESRRDAEEAKSALIGWSVDPTFADAGIWRTAIEKSTGKVVLTAETLTPELAAAIIAAYGTEKVVVDLEKDPAGHCAPNGGSVSTPATSMGSVASGTHENYQLGVGTVTVSGYSGYHGDGAIIQVAAGKSSSAWIYRGAYNSNSGSGGDVIQVWSRRAAPGDAYCTGGSFSGEICNWTVYGVGQDLRVYNNYSKSYEVARYVATSRSRTGWCARPGDSGGSVFTTVSGGVAAKGIHNGGGGGGSDYYGGLNDYCTEYFTDIWDIYYGLPGYLAT